MSSPENHQKSVWIHDEKKKIIYYKESAKPTKETLNANFDLLEEICKPYDKFYVIIDLTLAERPTAETRQHVSERLFTLRPRILHLAMFTGKNIIINMAVMFTFRKIGLESYSIHKSLSDSEKALEEIIK